MFPAERSGSGNISVLIAESTVMGGQLIAGALKRCRKFNVLDPVCNYADALRLAAQSGPQVAVISTQLEDGPLIGFKLLHQIRSSGLSTAAVMLTDENEPDLVIDSFRSGARGVFCRRNSLKSLSKCIRTVHSGQLWISNEQIEFLFKLITRLKPMQLRQTQHTKVLTKREADIVRLVAEGMRNSEIAVELNLVEHTVRNYLFRIFEKLGLSSRVELVLYSLTRQQLAEPMGTPDKILDNLL